MMAALLLLFAAAASNAAAPDPSTFDTGMENHAGLVFSPDGGTAYWTAWNGAWGSKDASRRTIYVSHLVDGAWSEPAVAPFSGRFSDDDPFVSPDGRWLYFVSERAEGDADIWRYNLAGDSKLERLDINSDAAEYSPIVTASGNLYFASARDGGPGQGDIYRAAAVADGFASPEVLGPALNSATGEWNLWVSPDETEILFEASSRPTNISAAGDLYYSRLSPTGWTAAVPVAELNSEGSDLLPRMHPDGRTLYYTTAPIGGHASIRVVEWPLLKGDLSLDLLLRRSDLAADKAQTGDLLFVIIRKEAIRVIGIRDQT